MSWQLSDPRAGLQSLTLNDTVQNHPLGTIARGCHPTLGEGEFIYLQGIGSTVVGSLVNYDANFVTELDTTALAVPAPLAVAMSACVASEFGWYQISGQATVRKSNAVSFAAGAALAAGSGLAIAVVSGLIVNGAVVAVVASAKSDVTTVRVMTNRPHNPSDVS
jgi:hypothetical protein